MYACAYMQVVAGEAERLDLVSQPPCEMLSVTNSPDADTRQLLAGAVLQLVDTFGNSCCCSDAAVTAELQLKPGMLDIAAQCLTRA